MSRASDSHAPSPRRRAPSAPPPPVHDLDGMLRRLHLPTVRRLYAELATRAEAEGMSYHTYLETLIAEEIAHRAETRLTRAVRKARFPFLRTIDDFNFTFQTALKLQMLGSYLGPELVSEGTERDLQRPEWHREIPSLHRDRVPRDSTRLRGALRRRRRADRRPLPRGEQERGSRPRSQPYLHPHVLIIDEFGYLSHAADAANVLYRVINERYLAAPPDLAHHEQTAGGAGRCRA